MPCDFTWMYCGQQEKIMCIDNKLMQDYEWWKRVQYYILLYIFHMLDKLHVYKNCMLYMNE